jgi:glycosyltransferase involved in cell wall biosynthesis
MKSSVAILRAGWLPTRQANGLQTISMGNAFAELGLRTTLYYIPSPFAKDDPLRFHAADTPLALKTLPRAVLPIRKSFKLEQWKSFPSFFHAFIWSGFVTYLASRSKADFYFVREPMIAWWLGQRGLPTVLEIHDIPNGIERIFIRKASHQSSVKLVLAVTEHLRADLARQLGVPAEKLLTLHDGIDFDTSSCSITNGNARRKLGLPLDKPLVVYTGKLDTEKGVEVLARAAPMLNDIHIVIVGDGPLADGRLQRLVRDVNATNVTLVGFKSHSDVLVFQKAADVLVLPHSMKYLHSAYYTSPLKLFEYMAAGVPIVATKLPATNEVLRHGENGWLVRPDSPSALAEGIRHVLANGCLASALAQQATQDAKLYSWERRATRIVESLSL